MKKLIIYTDGGARGNPGPAGIGVVIYGLDKSHSTSSGQVKTYAETIGNATNNVAEYKAIILALKKTKSLLKKEISEMEIEIRSDSELVVRQMNGIYRVKEEGLKLLHADVLQLTQVFKKVHFKHIPREQNKLADKLVNEALDALL